MIEQPPPNLADLLILAARYSGRTVQPEDRLHADLDINGTDFIEFVEEVERRYGVDLDWVSPRNGGEATDPTIAAPFKDVLSQKG